MIDLDRIDALIYQRVEPVNDDEWIIVYVYDKIRSGDLYMVPMRDLHDKYGDLSLTKLQSATIGMIKGEVDREQEELDTLNFFVNNDDDSNYH